jgi:hypothetical protein
MQTRITPEEMEAASRQLAKTQQGRAAMRQLIVLMDGGALDLDLLDQRALLALLGGIWSGRGDAAREFIRTSLARPDERG